MNIDELQKHYGLKNHHIHFSQAAQNKVGLRGKRVLEVGGSLPENFVFNELGVKQWVAIEHFEYWEELPTDKQGKPQGALPTRTPDKKLADVTDYDETKRYCLFAGGVEELPAVLCDRFDVVFSIAAFEHITMFPMALGKMFQALKPGGFLFSMWSPIWSAHDGHHLPTMVDKSGKEMNFGNSPIPPWGHLLMKPPELYKHLLKFTDSESAAKIVYFVYHSPHINRLFTEDYVSFINDSRLGQGEVTGIFLSPIKPEVQTRLEQLHPGRKHFANNGLMVVLERPAVIQPTDALVKETPLTNRNQSNTINVKLNKEQYDLVLKAQDFLKRNDNAPVILLTEISTACNARCIFCPHQYGVWKNKWKRSTIKDEFFYNAIDQFREMGGRYVSLTPMQGEPLLDKNILKKIEYAKGFDLLYFYTNGTLLDRFDLDELLESGITHIFISTTFPDREYFFKTFGTDKYNIPNIGNLLKAFANSKRATVNRISIEFRSGVPLPQIYAQHDFKKFIQPYLSNRVSISNMNFFDSFNGIIKKSNLLEGMIIKEDNVQNRLIPCFRVYNIYLGVDGDLRLCGCRFDPYSEVDELHIGNMRTTNLRDALNSPKAKSIVSSFLSLKNLSLCQKCSWYEPVNRGMQRMFDK